MLDGILQGLSTAVMPMNRGCLLWRDFWRFNLFYFDQRTGLFFNRSNRV